MPLQVIPLKRSELNLDNSILSGQAFRWQRNDDNWWSCLLRHKQDDDSVVNILLRIKREGETLICDCDNPLAVPIMERYFQLKVKLSEIHTQLLEGMPHIDTALTRFAGLRVLNQDPIECLFSFICTSAAPLHRIRRSILGICQLYGEGFANSHDTVHFSFPSVVTLAAADITEMQKLGLGYRAKFIKQAANQILERGGENWLYNLSSGPYPEAKAALMELSGVGAKIADCVCLFSLQKNEAIPVDTHVRQIAIREFGERENGSFSSTAYNRIGDAWRSRFGNYAGWAQQYLFFDHLYERGSWNAYKTLYGL